jgi:hypothetical protein
MNKDVTIISKLSEIINSAPLKGLLTRKDMQKSVLEALPQVSPDSIDSTRNYLTQAGYLKWMSRGLYAKMKDVPEGITYEKLLVEAYPKPYKEEVPTLAFHSNEEILIEHDNKKLIYYNRVPKSLSVIKELKSYNEPLMENIWVMGDLYNLYAYNPFFSGAHVLLPVKSIGQLDFVFVLKPKLNE